MADKKIKLNIGKPIIISASVSKEQLEILDLLSLHHQTTRSAMFAKLIIDHSDIDASIRAIAERVVANYCEINVNFDDFLRSAGIWLEQKKISQYYIERIIQEVRNRYAA